MTEQTHFCMSFIKIYAKNNQEYHDKNKTTSTLPFEVTICDLKRIVVIIAYKGSTFSS